jgi:redox-sensitive bicupin YhaK (pirin superfamily)
MSEIREVVDRRKARTTREGAGVLLNRVFGVVDEKLDPFLLLDHFGSERPEEYLAGFPWHPHRGIETITYMLSGTVEHGDSLGNQGVIGPGDVQWMTAGSGIVHQEMPQRAPVLEGFQLWANLPRAHKMMEPRYRDVTADQLADADLGPGARARVICGEVAGVAGPVQDIVTGPLYLDLTLDPGAVLDLPLDGGRNAFAYVFRGSASFGAGADAPVVQHEQAVLGPGAALSARAGADGARMLLVAGKPIGEPVAWGGPIVMNTQEELSKAFQEYEDGTFLRHHRGR